MSETMTRERMRELQQATPSNPRAYFRVDRTKCQRVALEAGALAVAQGVDPATGWWKELARLTPPERKQVRADLVELTRTPKEG